MKGLIIISEKKKPRLHIYSFYKKIVDECASHKVIQAVQKQIRRFPEQIKRVLKNSRGILSPSSNHQLKTRSLFNELLEDIKNVYSHKCNKMFKFYFYIFLLWSISLKQKWLQNFRILILNFLAQKIAAQSSRYKHKNHNF